MKPKIDLVDIGGGNIGSVSRCLQRLGADFRQVSAGNPPDGSRPLVVPGVGNFGAVMQSLRQSQLDEVLCNLVRSGTPFLGICVGMQVLFDSSEESKDVPGLKLISGKVVRFDHPKVPQIGWNKLSARSGRGGGTVATTAGNGWQDGYAYFVNSYYPVPSDEEVVLYTSTYGGTFCAAVQHNNITAFQFHPEKSGPFGESLLRRWLENVG